jgi:hypothetical protein
MSRRWIVLALAAALLAGCHATGPDQPDVPTPTPTIPPLAPSSSTTLVSALPRFQTGSGSRPARSAASRKVAASAGTTSAEKPMG